MANSKYSDLNQYTPTNKPLLTDVEAISQSINNILATRSYERLFNNDFSLDFEDELFELIDDAAAIEILRVIVERVERFEPRVRLNLSLTDVIPDPDANRFTVNLVYSLVGFEDEPDLEFLGIVA